MSYLFHPRLALVTRLILGSFLICASGHKILDPPDFAKIVFNYKVVPAGAINLAAIYMPWLEMFVGVALLLGVGRLGSSVVACLLMATFIGVLSFNLARGCPTICGCFDTHASGASMTDAEKFASMRSEIYLDIGLLLLGCHVLVTYLRNRRWRLFGDRIGLVVCGASFIVLAGFIFFQPSFVGSKCLVGGSGATSTVLALAGSLTLVVGLALGLAGMLKTARASPGFSPGFEARRRRSR